VDKPLIQYGVEEAIAAGCETNHHLLPAATRRKSKITSGTSALIDSCWRSGQNRLLAMTQARYRNMARIAYVRQKGGYGLGHAVTDDVMRPDG